MEISEHIKTELWRRGVIAPWYLYEHQQILYNMINTDQREMLVPNIARRFGKSTSCAVYCIEQALLGKCDVRYATAFLTDLEGFIKPIFDHILVTCPEDVRPKYIQSRKTYEFANGSTIKLIGLDKNPNGLRGNAISICVIDEAAFVGNLEYLYKSIIIPATANRQFKLIFPSTPPVDSEHFWLTLVQSAKERGTYLELTLDDNTSIGKEERERLLEEVGGRDSGTAQREFYCKTIRDPNTIIIPEFDSSKHVMEKSLELPGWYYPQMTIDFGGSVDMTGLICAYYDFKRAKFCIIKAALIKSNTSTSKLVDKARDMEKVFTHEHHIDRVADCFGQTRTDLGELEYYTRAPKKEKGSVEANINNLRIAFHQGLIEIDPSCRDLILTLELGQWTKKGDFKRTETLGHCDLIAALSYAYREKLDSNPYPVYEGYSPDKSKPVIEEEVNFLHGHL